MTHSEAAMILKNPARRTPAEIDAAGQHAARVLAAMPDERPMSLEAVQKWTQTPYAKMIYVEFRNGNLQGVNGMDAGKGAGVFERLLQGGGYGVDWRCWDWYPLADGRAECAWEDAPASL